jgi:hydroxyethylthiazole kinase-like uncharacterized protein yjeF
MNSSLTDNSPSLWLAQFPFPKADGHKYDRGSAVICGGDMTGATRLAARAAQRVGAGVVTLAAPRKSYAIYAESLESVIVREADTIDVWKELLSDAKRNAILIGPGLGLGATHADYVLAALDAAKPCVLDADALTNFEPSPDTFFAKLNAQCVLTPHEGEFARLFGKHLDMKADRLDRVRSAAQIAGCVVLLKGSETLIAQSDGKVMVNKNAPPWLATAGAGDVLAGIILGLVTQGMPPFLAASAGAWIHGQSATDFGPGLIAEDIITGIPGVLRALSAAGKQE